MKRFSSILLAALVATLMLVSNLRAQQYSGGAGPVDWQNALATWNVPTFPGQLNDNTIAIINATAAPTINNAGGIANRVRALQVNSNSVVTLGGTGTIVIGALNLNGAASGLTITAGLNVVIDSIIDGAAGSLITVNAGGKLTLRKGTNAPAQQVLLGGTIMAAGSLNGEVVIENGFNGGNFPTNIFYTAPPAAATAMACLNAITVTAPMNIGENITTAAAGGIFTVNGGTLQINPGGTLQLNQTGANSLQGTGNLNAAIGGSVVLAANFNANILPGQRFRNPFLGTLTVNSPLTVNSDMTFSPASPTAAQESILNLLAATASLTVPAGVTVRFNNNINNGVQGPAAANVVIVNAGATVILGSGFNAGVIPSARFSTINGTLQTIGAMSLNVTGAPAGGMFSSTGQFEIGGDLTLAGAGTFEISQTGPNSIRATAGSNARIIAPGRNTIVRFNANANNGVLPGCLFQNPFSGGMDIRSSMNLSCDLFMATDGGPVRFDATTVGVNTPIILTIQPSVTLALRQNVATNLTGVVAAADPRLCYIQGANNTSNLILGLGANGGTVPSPGTVAVAPTIPFLPLSGDATFNGRLTLEGSLTFATNLAMGTGSILDLAGGNLTVQDTRTLRLLNSGSNSLIGTGVIQAVAPTLNGYAQNTNFGTAALWGSMVEIGASMNGAVFPAARFANPFQGNINFSTAGSITVQGDFVHGIPQGRGYFVIGAITSNANITIAANSSVRLNTINPSSFIGSEIKLPPVPVFPGGSFQGADATSRLVFGVGHANESAFQAVTTTGTFLVAPFNGTLAFASNTIIYTSATIGVTGGLELGGMVIVTSGTRYGATGTVGPNSGHNRVHPTSNPAATNPYISPITITLNNQAAGSISGLGTFLTATGNTLVFGSGANGGIIPGNRLESPHFGTIATVGAMTLSGNLTIGDLRDGYVDRDPTAANPVINSSGFLKLGDRLTIDNGAALTVSNATAQPFSTRFAGNASVFQVSTSGTGVIQALPNGELRLLDGLNARNTGGGSTWNPAQVAALPQAHAVTGAVTSTSRNEISAYVPTQSFFHPGFLASPFNGKLFFGSDMPQAGHATLAARSFAGGLSRFNLTTGTLTIGSSGFLGLISPLYVSAGTINYAAAAVSPQLSDGFPRVILQQTGANSFTGTTTGSFIQSSVGTFSGTTTQFFMGHQHGNNVTGGSVVLGPGFNAGIISASLFGSPVSGSAGGGPSRVYSGRLVMPASGSLTLTGVLTMNSWVADDGNYGIFDLGSGNSVVSVQDGSTLSLGTTGTVVGALGAQDFFNQALNNVRGSGVNALPLVPGNAVATAAPQGQGVQSARGLQGTGTIQGLGNNARVVFPGNLNDGFVEGRFFANPFNGRLVISTGNTYSGSIGAVPGQGGYSRAFLFGDLVFGAVGTSNGVLEVQAPTYTATNFTNNVAPHFVLVSRTVAPATALHLGSSLTFNNISPVSVVLPGNGAILSTTNQGRIIIGPNALGNIIPATQLQPALSALGSRPFVGQLIVTTGSTSPFALNSNLTLAADQPSSVLNTVAAYGSPGDISGYLRTFAPIKLNSNVSLTIQNQATGALSGTVSQTTFGTTAGAIDATDVSSVVRFITAQTSGLPANAGVIGTTVQSQQLPAATNPRHATVGFSGFNNPFNGSLITDIASAVPAPVASTPARNVYHLYGRVVLGASGSSNGILNASGATIVLAAADLGGLGVNSTVANLVVNNVSAAATALPGAGLISVRGLTNGVTPTFHGHPAPMAIGSNAGGNASMAFGPGALAGNLPNNRFQMDYHNQSGGSSGHNPLLGAMGNAVANDDRAAAAYHDLGPTVNANVNPRPGIRGTLMTSTGTMIATTGNMRFSSGGTLLIGGPDLRYSATGVAPAANVPVSLIASLSIPDGVTVTIATTHRSAFGGNGSLVLGGTSATLEFAGDFTGITGGDGGNDGVIYGAHIGGGQTIGRVVINSNNRLGTATQRNYTELRGNLRFGDGSNVAGHLAFTTASAQLMVGTNSTLNLASTKVIALVSNNSGMNINSGANNAATATAFAAQPAGLIIGPGGATAFAGSHGANSGTTSSVVVFGPEYGRFRHSSGTATPNNDRTFALGAGVPAGSTGIGGIDQGVPVLNSNTAIAVGGANFGHTGTVITSSGTIAITGGNFSLLGQIEMGGKLNLEVGRTAQFNNVAANSFRATTGSNGHLRANPDAATGVATVVLGPNVSSDGNNGLSQLTSSSFNAGVLPANLFGRAPGTVAANLVPTTGVDGEITNAFGTTRATAQLQINSSNLTLSGGNLYMFGDLVFTANGGDINIPANAQLTLNGGFTHNTARPGVITGAGSSSVLAVAAAANLNNVGANSFITDNTLNANSPQIGDRGGSGFRGTLRLLSSNFDESTPAAYAGSPNNVSRSNLGINGITVTIATVGAIDMESTRSTIVFRGTGSRLNLNNTGANSFMPTLAAAIANGTLREATTSIISLQAPTGNPAAQAVTVGTVSFGAGFNASTVPGNLLSAYRLQSGAAFIMNSNLNLGSEMFVSTNGSWNFNSGTNKLTLGAFNMTVNGSFSNNTTDRYFVTNGAGFAGLNGVGNVTFPVGPSSTLYTPINIVNNAAASLFSVRAVNPIAPITAPLAAASGTTVAQGIVGVRWNVVQNNNVAQGLAVTLTPQWPTGQETGGFNRSLAVVNRYASNVVAQSSTPAVAPPVPALTNYFQSSLVVSQTATPGLLTAATDIVVTSQPQPTITSFNPTAAASSQTVTIVGSRFVNVSSVTFGGTPATFTVSAAGDTIRAVIGQGATGSVVVTQTGGSATASGTFTYLGAPPQTPVIIYAAPQPVSAGLGDVQMTITGTGFGSNTVRVVATGSGAQGTITPISNSATAITFTLPGQFSRNVGSVTLTVTSVDKNPVSTTITVSVAPATTITSITPSSTSGSLSAHTVFITGTAFGPQATFTLNSTVLRVMSFVSNTNGTFTAGVEIPVGAVSGNVVVTNLNNSTAQLPFSITNLPRPIITGVTPAAIAPGSGDRLITVTGQNLIPGAVVTFNGVAIGNVTTTSTSVQFVVPAALLANPDLATIRITNPDNQSIGYRFPISNGLGEAPVISVDPTTGRPLSGVVTPATTNATAQAFQLTINGANFATAATVSFGGTPVTIVSNTGTRLVVNIPASLNVAGMFQVQVANSVNAVVGFPYTIGPRVDPPAISRVAVDGNNLVIIGDNFRTGATVQLGSTVLTVVSVELGRIVVVAPDLPRGTYTLVVTNTDGQFATQLYQYAGRPSSVRERFAGTRMYPNPTVDVVNVEATLERSAEVVITISNTLGQNVMTVRQNASAGFFTKSVNVQNLPTGAYTVEITDGTRRSVEKIIKN